MTHPNTLAMVREALRNISQQRTTEEREIEGDEPGDYEFAYNVIVKEARKANEALSSLPVVENLEGAIQYFKEDCKEPEGVPDYLNYPAHMGIVLQAARNWLALQDCG